MSSQPVTQAAQPTCLADASHAPPGQPLDRVICATSQQSSGSVLPQTGGAASVASPASSAVARRHQTRQLDIIFSASWNKKTGQASTHIRLQLAAIPTPRAETPGGGETSPSQTLPPLTQSFNFENPAESTRHAKFLALEQSLREASTWLDELHIRPQCISLKIAAHNRITYVPQRRGKAGKLRISEAKTWIERCLRDDIYRHLDGYRSWSVVHTHKQVAKSILGLLVEKPGTNPKQAETIVGVSSEGGVGAVLQGVGATTEQPGEVRQAGESVSAVYLAPALVESLAQHVSAQPEHLLASPDRLTDPIATDAPKSANGFPRPEADKATGEAPVAPEPVETVPQFPIDLTITFDGGLSGAGLAYGRYHLTCSAAPALKLPIQIDLGKLVVFGQKITRSSDATEYLALFTAVRHVQRRLKRDSVDLNLVQVQVFSDSQNLAQQLQHIWHTNSPELLHLQTQLELELARFGKWQVNWLGKLQIDHALKAIPMPVRPATQLAGIPESSNPLVAPNTDIRVIDLTSTNSVTVDLRADHLRNGVADASLAATWAPGEPSLDSSALPAGTTVSASALSASNLSARTLSGRIETNDKGVEVVNEDVLIAAHTSSLICETRATRLEVEAQFAAAQGLDPEAAQTNDDPAEAARTEVMRVMAEAHEDAATGVERSGTDSRRKAVQLPAEVEAAITNRLEAYIAEHPVSADVQTQLHQAMRHVAHQQMQMPQSTGQQSGAQGHASRAIQIGFAPAQGRTKPQPVASHSDSNAVNKVNKVIEVEAIEVNGVTQGQSMLPQMIASGGFALGGTSEAVSLADPVTGQAPNPTLPFDTYPTANASAHQTVSQATALVTRSVSGLVTDQVNDSTLDQATLGRTTALLPDSPAFQAQRWLQQVLAMPRGTWGALQPISDSEGAGDPSLTGADAAEADDLDAALRLVAVRTYAELNLAVQRSKAVGAYRIWLLARYLDTKGEGKLPLAILNDALCDANAGLHMTKRQLQNLLAAGEGIFFDRYKIGRETIVKLRGVGRVALFFKLDKLRYRAAYVPVDWLRMGHGASECVLYTALHAARGHDERNNAPISRATLSSMTGRSVRALLLYDRVAGTTRRTNIAHTGIASHTEDLDLIKDAYGPAAFTMGRGYKFGKPQGLEVVLRLPNSYRATLAIQAQNVGRKKRVNQLLMSLLAGSPVSMLKSVSKKAVQEDSLTLKSLDTLMGTTLVGIGEQAAQIKVGREIKRVIGTAGQEGQKDQDGQKGQGVPRNGATRKLNVKRERVFYDDLQSARDMTAARRAVSARLRGQLADPDLPAAQRPRFEGRILHMERGFYSLNRVEDGVGRYVIMGNLSLGGEPKPVVGERDARGFARGVHPDALDHDLKQVRKEFDITRKSHVRTLRFDVRNLKVQTNERCEINT